MTDPFDVMCADMALHGWQPVRSEAGNYGVFNPDIDGGFVWVDSEMKVKRLVGAVTATWSVHWSALGSERLSRIEQRLRQV